MLERIGEITQMKNKILKNWTVRKSLMAVDHFNEKIICEEIVI